MKILLVSAVNPKHPRDLVQKPLGLAYIASYLRRYGGHTDIQIVNGLQETEGALKQNPDVVAISSVSQNFNVAISIAKAVKEHGDIPVIVGGHHITALPQCLTVDMDIAVLGEGEQTVLELVRAFEQGKPTIDIAGTAYYDDHLIVAEAREQLRSLDVIPFPARDLLNLKANELYLFTSRGCPARCPYCSSSHFWKTVRFHSPEYVISEIKELIEKYHPEGITIYDDLFIADRKRFRKIVELIEYEKINEKVSFSVQARVNFVDDESCELLKRMNASVVCGFESGSPDILRFLKNLNIKKNWDAVATFQKHGIEFSGSFMIGIPGETEEDMDMTLDFIKKNPFSGAEGYVLTPFPGTKIWDYARSLGAVSDNMDWDKLNIDFDMNWKDAIILSDMDRKKLHERYQMLRNECEKKSLSGKSVKQIIGERGIRKLISSGLRSPKRALDFIRNIGESG